MDVKEIHTKLSVKATEEINIMHSGFGECNPLDVVKEEINTTENIKPDLDAGLEFDFLKPDSYSSNNGSLIDHDYDKGDDKGESPTLIKWDERTIPHNEFKNFDCISCKITFPTEQHLRDHLNDHKEKGITFKCGICGKDYNQSYLLKHHVRKTHFMNKKFVCTLCHKSFAFLDHLKNHLSVHTGEKNFTCSVCPKSFRQKGHLINHIRIHLGLKKFCCPICDRKFTQNIHMKNHLKTHTGEKNYKCKICHKGFIQSGQLKNHMAVHTGERKYECQQCGMRFKQSGHLIGHFKTHNKIKS